MAKAPKPDQFADDYAVESERIWEEAAGVVIWPSFEVYQRYKNDYDSNPTDPKWEPLVRYGDANPFTRPIAEEIFAAWREKQIEKYVEEGCKPLVRHIMAKGLFTYYSNAVGHGTKGVGFTDDLLRYKDTGEGYFYFLKGWDTDPQINTLNHMSFGSVTCRLPASAKNNTLKAKFGFDELPQVAPTQPARPAKKKQRKAKPKRDNDGLK